MRHQHQHETPATKAKPLIGGVWFDKAEGNKENSGDIPGAISLDDFFAHQLVVQVKNPEIAIETLTDISPMQSDISPIPHLITPDSTPSAAAQSRSLVGGWIPPSTEDEVSLSSTSLMGAGYVNDQQSVSTKLSYGGMEYSEDERSIRQERQQQKESLLNIMPTTSRARYLLDRQDDASESTAGDEHSSVFSDAYFRRNPILPPSSLLPPGGSPSRSSIASGSPYRSPRSPLGFLSGMDTTTTEAEIYEDVTFDSTFDSASDMDAPHFFEDGDSSTSTPPPSPPRNGTQSPLSWSAYNKERGRTLAQRLLSSMRTTDDAPESPTLTSPSLEESPLPKKKHFLQHSHNYLRRKNLQKDFTLVDATVKETVFSQLTPLPPPSDSSSAQTSLADDSEHSEHSSSTTLSPMFPKLPSCESLYELARADADEHDDYVGDPYLDVVDTTAPAHLPDGLAGRKSPSDIASAWKKGVEALKLLRLRLLLATSRSDKEDGTMPTVTVEGIQVPNYQAHVQQSVDKYRRDVLKVSDEAYQLLLRNDEKKV